ncbi:hypothetical protein DDA98_10780 [Clostridium perfringens]|uniref:hypothetical protein n=1 Tax=Clostridium perfringens TaxID=1502 RepID=UPI000D51AC89|nr:hypothetical protein [Clostridium perfringens]EHK2280454.1 hypothetical protein [Clostridium perfringens]ELC8405544.1 hypothetical protein [Clostridium perfringens]PVE15307.1 hypothetical protein DDA98_10780 [Clostridium perfringens]
MKDFSLGIDFNKLINEYPNVKSLINQLGKYGELFLFGGAIREYNDTKFSEIPRDFDIVIDKKDKNLNLDDILKKFSYKKNRFNGYKLKIDSLEFDIWELENTWAFKENKVKCLQGEYSKKLQETVFLNIDSLVYNLNTQELYDDKYMDAMKKKELDVVLEENPFKELNLIRALIFKRKYNMALSKQLKSIFKDYVRSNDNYINSLYEIQFKHYNEYKIDKNTIEKEINSIIN